MHNKVSVSTVIVIFFILVLTLISALVISQNQQVIGDIIQSIETTPQP